MLVLLNSMMGVSVVWASERSMDSSGMTVMLNDWLSSSSPSEIVISTGCEPMWLLVGVPLKMNVSGSKLSHSGAVSTVSDKFKESMSPFKPKKIS